MANSANSTPHGVRTIDLPPSLRTVDLDGSASDARHLGELLSAALDRLVALQVKCPDDRADVQRATALLWVARDLTETLEWKIDQLIEAESRRR